MGSGMSEETKRIILSRLKAEAIGGFENPEPNNELFPLNDHIVNYLFEQTNLSRKTTGMTAFGDVEQIIHDSILASLEQQSPGDKKGVDIQIVKEKFKLKQPEIENISSEQKLEISFFLKNSKKHMFEARKKNRDEPLHLL